MLPKKNNILVPVIAFHAVKFFALKIINIKVVFDKRNDISCENESLLGFQTQMLLIEVAIY